MAMGARRIDVLRLVVTSATQMAITGLTIGIGISLVLTRALSSLLFGVIRIDIAVFVLYIYIGHFLVTRICRLVLHPVGVYEPERVVRSGALAGVWRGPFYDLAIRPYPQVCPWTSNY